MRLHHTAISVSNLAASVKFYRDILGLKVIRERTFSGPAFEAVDVLPVGSSVQTALMDAGDDRYIQLSEYAPKGRLPRPDSNQCDIGLVHIGFRVTQIETLYEELGRKGVKLNCPIQTVGKDVKVFSIDDPDGVRVEFLEILVEWQ